MTSAATLSSAIQIARGTWRAAPLVSSEALTQASKPMNTQPATASAASMPAPTEPPDSSSAPSVCVEDRDVLRAEDEQQRESDADRGDDLGGDSGLDHAAQDVDALRPDAAQTSTRTIPVTTIAFAVGVDADEGRAPTGRRGTRSSCCAAQYAQIATQPLSQPYVPPDQPAAPLIRASGDRELRRELRVHGEQQALAGQRDRQHPHPRRAGDDHADEHDGVEPDDGEIAAKPSAALSKTLQPARELLRIAELVQARGVRVDRRRAAEVTPAVSVAPAPLALDRPRDVDARRDAELVEDVADVRLDRLVAEEQRRRDLAVRQPIGDEAGDLELALRQRVDARCRPPPPARAARPALRAGAARGASRRARAPSRTRRAPAPPRAAPRSPARARRRRRARAPPGCARRRPAAAPRPQLGGLGRLVRDAGRLERLAARRAGPPPGARPASAAGSCSGSCAASSSARPA